MKYIFTVLLVISLIIYSCKKESSDLIKQNKNILQNQIDTTIHSNDTLHLGFGYFGDEEGVTIITQPKNSKYCEILNNQLQERILQYIPQDNFLGIDSVSVVSMKGSDGAGPSTNVDTILVIIQIVKDNF